MTVQKFTNQWVTKTPFEQSKLRDGFTGCVRWRAQALPLSLPKWYLNAAQPKRCRSLVSGCLHLYPELHLVID